MPSRRDFLQTSAVVSALAMHGGFAGRAGAVSSARATAVQVRHALYDDRYEAGKRFAATVAARGVDVRALDEGDVTRFWYDVLDPLWRSERAAVAGTTQFGPFFALERLAAERGLEVVLRAEHRSLSNGAVEHVLTASRPVLAAAAELGETELDWPTAMGLLACDCDGAVTERVTAALRMAGPSSFASLELAPEQRAQSSFIHYYTPQAVQQGYGVAIDGPLFTWLIAPTARPSLTDGRG